MRGEIDVCENEVGDNVNAFNVHTHMHLYIKMLHTYTYTYTYMHMYANSLAHTQTFHILWVINIAIIVPYDLQFCVDLRYSSGAVKSARETLNLSTTIGERCVDNEIADITITYVTPVSV